MIEAEGNCAIMIYILDAAAILNNESFSFDSKNRYFTTSHVFSEWRDFRSRGLAENAAQAGSLSIADPCPLSIEKAHSLCAASSTRLGRADISIAALSLEFSGRGEKFAVITDDYSVQNVLKKAGIDFIGVAQGEIKRHRKFGKRKKQY